MRRLRGWILCLTLAFALVVPMHRASAQTGVSISLHIGDRYRGPDLGFRSEPSVVAVQGDAGVYYVRDSDYDVYRYDNIWYMNYDGDWYRASDYRGPWIFVGYQSVPRNVYTVPTQYRRRWSDYRDTHYNWGSGASRTAPERTRTPEMTTPYRARSGSQTVTESPTRTRVAPAATTRRSSRHRNRGGHGQNHGQRHHGQGQNQGQDQSQGH